MTKVFPFSQFLHEIKINRNAEEVLGKTYESRVCSEPKLDHLRLFLTPIEYKDGCLECEVEMKIIKQPTREVAQ